MRASCCDEARVRRQSGLLDFRQVVLEGGEDGFLVVFEHFGSVTRTGAGEGLGNTCLSCDVSRLIL